MLQLVNHCSVCTLSPLLLVLHSLYTHCTVVPKETETFILYVGMTPVEDIAMTSIGVQSRRDKMIMPEPIGLSVAFRGGRISISTKLVTKVTDIPTLMMRPIVTSSRAELIELGSSGKIRLVPQLLWGLCVSVRGFVPPLPLLTSE